MQAYLRRCSSHRHISAFRPFKTNYAREVQRVILLGELIDHYSILNYYQPANINILRELSLAFFQNVYSVLALESKCC